MPSFRLILIISAIITVAAVGGFAVANQQQGQDFTLTYYDGDDRIYEQTHSGAPELFSPAVIGEDRTFYGWSLKKDFSGTIMKPGSRQVFKDDAIVYAVVVDGTVSYDSGNVVFSMDRIRDTPAVIDLRFVGDVNRLTISKGTVGMFADADTDVRVRYRGGFETLFDNSILGSCRIMSGNGPAYFTSVDIGGGKDFAISANEGRVDDAGDGIGIRMPLSVPVGAVLAVTHASDSGKRIKYEMVDGCAVFTIKEMGFRTAYMFTITVVDANGNVIVRDSPDFPELLDGDSEPLDPGTQLSKGDLFKIVGKKGTGYRVEGAVRDNGFYKVTGTAGVKIKVLTGMMEYEVILPGDPIGYRITADPETVKDGGRCTLTYELLAGYIDRDLVITVNGISVSMDSTSRIFVDDVHEDLYVDVSGVLDMRVYQIQVPKKQVGYSLVASAESVHHGQPYSFTFKIMEGYEKLPEFSVQVNGITVDTSSGIYSLKSVTGVQKITVDGIQMKKFKVTAGKNTVLKVGGFAVNTATVEDLIEVVPNGIYEIPQSFNDNLPLTAKVGFGGYKITGDAIFPSIVMVTVGENITVNDIGEGLHLFVCTNDKNVIKATSGYTAPKDYESKLTALGANCSKGLCLFSKDIHVPSIHKVTFIGFKNEFAIEFVSHLDPLPILKSDPKKAGYMFEKWDSSHTAVVEDVVVKSKWKTLSFNVRFGNNTLISFKNSGTMMVTENTSESERNMVISADRLFKVNVIGESGLPSEYLTATRNILVEDGWITVIGDVNFTNLSYITYCSWDSTKTKTVVICDIKVNELE